MPPTRLNIARDIVVKTLTTAGLSSAFACWWYRPAVDRRNGEGTRRSGGMSAIDYHDSYCRPYPLPMQLGAHVSTFLMVSGCRFFLYRLGDFQIKDDEHYRNFIEKSLHRDPRTPMFTLPNHRSLMDDPMVLASLLPFWMNAQPHFLRWAVCAQEICFREENVFTAFFGVGGKTLPICRGEGVDQPQLLQLARKAVSSSTSMSNGSHGGSCQTSGSTARSAGWVNIHSEAGIFQNKHALGGRSNGQEDHIGRLKWGAAKMIVHNPSYDLIGQTPGPVVIPFYVTGMDTVTPLNEHKRLIQPIPVPGHSVRVRFGPELRFDDLIEEHERAVGARLRRYHCCADPHCQQKATEAAAHEALAVNVRLSSAVSSGFDRVARSLQSLFWRAVNAAGVENSARVSHEEEEEDDDKASISSRGQSVCKNNNPPISSELMFDRETWTSTASEKELYSRVMLRIQDAMQRLCDENRRESEEEALELKVKQELESDLAGGEEVTASAVCSPTEHVGQSHQ